MSLPEGYRLVDRFPTYEECLGMFLAVGWDEYITEDFGYYQLERPQYYAVIEFEGKMVAMGCIRRHKETHYLENIAVLPDHQRRGLGTVIVQQLLAYLKVLDFHNTRAFLIALEGTQPFYEKFGFKYFNGSDIYMHQYLHRPTPEDEF